jgi:hypothetical protein
VGAGKKGLGIEVGEGRGEGESPAYSASDIHQTRGRIHFRVVMKSNPPLARWCGRKDDDSGRDGAGLVDGESCGGSMACGRRASSLRRYMAGMNA